MKLRTLVAVLAALIAPACAIAEQAPYTQASESSSAWTSRWSSAKETWDNVARFEINPALRTIGSNSYGSNCASIASPYPFQWCMNATTRQMQVYSNSTGSGAFGWHNALTINPDGTVAAPATFIPALTTLGINGTRDFAVCDGVHDDSTAISGLVGTGWTIPAGAVCNAPSVSFPAATFVGPGQIKASGGNFLAPYFALLSAPPASYGNNASVTTAFNGDLSKLFFAGSQYILDGNPSVGTLGRPTSGYVQHPETGSEYLVTYNASGWNQGTATNDGRTGTAAHYWQGVQAGQGDMTGWFFNCIGVSTRAGATSYLATPSCVAIAGQMSAFANGMILNIIGDANIFDNGFDITGFGSNINLARTNTTTALGNVWWGYRVTNLGATPVDAAFTAAGAFKMVNDCVDAYATVPCTVMKAGQRIYGNSTQANTSPLPSTVALGTEWLEYTATNGWAFGIGDSRIVQVKSTGADVTGTLSATTLLVPRGTPASSSAACTQNQMMQDATYIYTCVATNTWHRASNGATW